MAHADDMIYVAQSKLQKLVREDTSRIGEAKERMVRKHRPEAHRPRMEDGLMTETAQTCVPMDDLNLLSDDDVAEDWEEGKHRGHGGLAVNDEERDMIDLESIRQVSDAGAPGVGMCDDDDLMTAVDELLEKWTGSAM